MAERDLPLSVFHFDCFWMRGFRWCDFEWDPAVFPDPEAMLQRLHARGLKVCVWINSYIAQRSPLFEEGKKHGYLLKKTDGSVWQWDLWQPGMGIVDFTNPAACEWFAGHLKRLAKMGVDSFKTDFGERIPTEDVAWHDGSDPQKMHNFYPYLYNKVVFEALHEAKGEAALFARSATAGCGQFPVHWGGDCYSSFESMAETLRGGLSLGLSGFGFWSHDIGGFEGSPPVEVYKRWLAFGLLSSHSRLHGSSSYRVPWLFDDEAVDVCRHFTKLKCKLMPYLFQKAVEARDTGVPMMRAMLLEFPDDPACATLDQQYMLGDALLVAPIFRADNYGRRLPPRRNLDELLHRRDEAGRTLVSRDARLSLAPALRPRRCRSRALGGRLPPRRRLARRPDAPRLRPERRPDRAGLLSPEPRRRTRARRAAITKSGDTLTADGFQGGVFSMFVIEDENHSEQLGEYVTFEEALIRLQEWSKVAWDAPPKRAPCTSWKTCGRSYWIVEYKDEPGSTEPPPSHFIFEISATGIQWGQMELDLTPAGDGRFRGAGRASDRGHARESLERVGRFDPARARVAVSERLLCPSAHAGSFRRASASGLSSFKPIDSGLLLDHLYLSPAAQGQGIGGAALKIVFAEADTKALPISCRRVERERLEPLSISGTAFGSSRKPSGTTTTSASQPRRTGFSPLTIRRGRRLSRSSAPSMSPRLGI